MNRKNIEIKSKMNVVIFQSVDALGVKTDEKMGEYALEYYVQNEEECTVDHDVDKKDEIKRKESCLVYFKPDGPGKLEWNWYDNDKSIIRLSD